MVQNVQRYDSGRKETVLVRVASGVTVYQGDLMFLNSADNLLNDGSSIADNYAYPINYHRITGTSLQLNKESVKSYFLGVALDDKDGTGGDENISIAKTGIFNFDLKPVKTVYFGNYASPAGTTTASDMFTQKLSKSSLSRDAIGFFVENKLHAQTALIKIRSAFGSEGTI